MMNCVRENWGDATGDKNQERTKVRLRREEKRENGEGGWYGDIRKEESRVIHRRGRWRQHTPARTRRRA